MLPNIQTNTPPSPSEHMDEINTSGRRGIDPMTLVMLNFGLFRSLYSMGTSREKICATMLLNTDEFDYIVGLMNGQKFKTTGIQTNAARG